MVSSGSAAASEMNYRFLPSLHQIHVSVFAPLCASIPSPLILLEHLVPGHAGANLCPVIASNRHGREKDMIFYGLSFIADQVRAQFEKSQSQFSTISTFL